MKKLCLLMILVLGVRTNITSAQSDEVTNKAPSSEITFSILENSGPSWVYKLASTSPMTCEFQIHDLADSVLNSESISLQDEFISKFSASDLPNDFYLIVIENGTEIYRQQFSKQL